MERNSLRGSKEGLVQKKGEINHIDAREHKDSYYCSQELRAVARRERMKMTEVYGLNIFIISQLHIIQ